MEFYLICRQDLFLYTDSFNSQRDGILQRLNMDLTSFSTRFNSQRDGILPYPLLAKMQGIEFQFPTGWNSTKLPLATDTRKRIQVSIPNGMKFYSYSFYPLLPKTPVSIPNGMKFYNGFTWKTWFCAFRFQFPMGWNSTKPLNHTRRQHYVSIPNGMEFYAESDGSEYPDIVCFNSQWDGFYLDTQNTLMPRTRFQFPMGWNSTFLFVLGIFLAISFQFPMGWNSTCFTKRCI